MKEILIKGYFNKNLGDDLFFKLLASRYEKYNFYMFINKENIEINIKNLKLMKKSFIHRIVNFIFRKLTISYNFYEEKFLKKKKIDTIIEIGGSLFMEFGKISSWKKMINFKEYEIMKYTPNYYILGANFGAYKTKDFYDIHYNFFKKCKDVSFREKYSYDLFNSLPNIRYNKDIIFSLNPNKLYKEKEYILISVIKPSRKPETNKMDEEYYASIKKVILECLENSKKVKLMSFCKAEGDEEAIREILNLISKDKLSQIETYYYSGNIEEALEVIGKSEAIVATRFHAMILGFVFRKKVYPIAYSKKTTNVLEDLNFQGNYCSFDDLKNMSYTKIIENKILDEETLESAKKSAEKHFEKLDLFFN